MYIKINVWCFYISFYLIMKLSNIIFPRDFSEPLKEAAFTISQRITNLSGAHENLLVMLYIIKSQKRFAKFVTDDPDDALCSIRLSKESMLYE